MVSPSSWRLAMAARRPARSGHAWFALSLPLLLLVAAAPAPARGDATALVSIGAGRLFTTEGWEIPFSGFTLLDLDSARYQAAGERRPSLVSATTLLRVQKLTGHEGRRSAVAGGAIGLVGGALGLWLGNLAGNGFIDAFSINGNGVSHSDDGIEVGPAVCIVSASVLVGSVFGYRLGARQKHYATVYEDPSLKRP